MTLELNLSPEAEARLQNDAAARREATSVAAQAVEVFILRPSADEAKSERRGVSRLKGRYPSTRTAADFMADRSSEEGEA